MERFEKIPIELIQPDPNQPRRHYSDRAITELADNMKQVGQIEPIGVLEKEIEGRQMYVIIYGERRFRAALIAGINYLDCHIRELNEDQIFEIQISENLQRENISPLDECDGYMQLMEKKKYSMEDLSVKFGKSTEYIFGRLKLINLITEAREKLENEIIPVSVAIKLSMLNVKQQLEAIKRLIVPVTINNESKEIFTGLKDMKAFLDNSILMPLSLADFNPKDENILPCGACTVCPKRSGQSLFGDITDVDKCLDSECYHDKHIRHYQALQMELSKKMKVQVQYAARHYSTEKMFKDLPDVISVYDYEIIDELQAKKDANARYVIFVGIDSTDKPGAIRHGWVKLKAKVIEKQDADKIKIDKKKEEQRRIKDHAIGIQLRHELYQEYQKSSFNSKDNLLINIAASLWGSIKTELLPYQTIQDLISRYSLGFNATIFDGEWRDVVVDKKYIHPEKATPLTIEISEFQKSISETISGKSLPGLIAELHFLSTITDDYDLKFIKDIGLSYGEAKRIATTKVIEAIKANEKKPRKKKKRRIYD